jgi:hypothetical protein
MATGAWRSLRFGRQDKGTRVSRREGAACQSEFGSRTKALYSVSRDSGCPALQSSRWCQIRSYQSCRTRIDQQLGRTSRQGAWRKRSMRRVRTNSDEGARHTCSRVHGPRRLSITQVPRAGSSAEFGMRQGLIELEREKSIAEYRARELRAEALFVLRVGDPQAEVERQRRRCDDNVPTVRDEL